jgi:chromosome segregation ATPase
VGVSTVVRANPADECAKEEYFSSVNFGERAVQRAQRIVNLALFEAIDQGSLRGVRFLLESGADPRTENRRGRTPLEFAEYLANKNPGESERREIVALLSNCDPGQREVNDQTIVKTAQKIYGLKGGGDVETKYEQYRAAQKRLAEAKASYETYKTKAKCSDIRNQFQEADKRFKAIKESYEAVKNRQEEAQRELEIAKREVEERRTQVRINCDRRNALSRKISDQWDVCMQCGSGIWSLRRIPEGRLRLTKEEIEEKKKSIKEKEETIEEHGGYDRCNCGLVGVVEKEKRELEEKEKELRELGSAIKEYEAIKSEHEKSMKELKLAEEKLKTATANAEELDKKSEEASRKEREERNKVEKISGEMKKAEDREKEESEKVKGAELECMAAQLRYQEAKRREKEAKKREEAEKKAKEEAATAAKKREVVTVSSSEDESSSDGVSVIEVATLLPGVGNVVGLDVKSSPQQLSNFNATLTLR